jgi:hypothetical protein
MKTAYAWHNQSGRSMLFRLSEDEAGNRSHHVYRASDELAIDHAGPPPDDNDSHWALILGPINFPELRDHAAEKAAHEAECARLEAEDAERERARDAEQVASLLAGSGSTKYSEPGVTDWLDRGEADHLAPAEPVIPRTHHPDCNTVDLQHEGLCSKADEHGGTEVLFDAEPVIDDEMLHGHTPAEGTPIAPHDATHTYERDHMRGPEDEHDEL